MSSKHCNQNYIYCNIDRHKKQSKVLMNTTADDTRFIINSTNSYQTMIIFKIEWANNV